MPVFFVKKIPVYLVIKLQNTYRINELGKLTVLWTTGPRSTLFSRFSYLDCSIDRLNEVSNHVCIYWKNVIVNQDPDWSHTCEIISIFHVCMVWIENLSRGSLIGITRLAEWCRTVIPSDRFFYPHHTPMIDTFSCIPFDTPHLIFKVELAMK